jgi:hypothetical protein
MASDGDYCRVKAEECAHLAKAAIAEDVKVRLLKLKQRWLETATLADAKNASAWRVVNQRVSPAWFGRSELCALNAGAKLDWNRSVSGQLPRNFQRRNLLRTVAATWER